VKIGRSRCELRRQPVDSWRVSLPTPSGWKAAIEIREGLFFVLDMMNSEGVS